MERGVWVDWVIHAKWSPKDDGVLRIWKDGEVVLDSGGANVYGTIGKEYTPYLKTGIYHPEWNLKSKAHEERFGAEIPGIKTKEVYVGRVVVGSEKASFEEITGNLERPTKSKKVDKAAQEDVELSK